MNQKPILHVEDNPDDALLVKLACHRAGLEVPIINLPTVEESCAYLAGKGRYGDRKAYPLPSVILLDIRMPGLDGWDLLEAVRQNPEIRSLPIWMLTSSWVPEDMDKAKDLGANAYYIKTCFFEDVIIGLRRHLESAARSPTVPTH